MQLNPLVWRYSDIESIYQNQRHLFHHHNQHQQLEDQQQDDQQDYCKFQGWLQVCG